jgi:fructose-1,6-bisphosphatase/inositol monophosphatase family enzyme
VDTAPVAELLRAAADEVVLPRWRALRPDQVAAKSRPDDLVTVADTEAESIITAGLLALRPGTPVIGEEAVAADPSLLDGLATLPAYWLVDPVDGTGNFVDGSPDFGVMVALVEDAEVTAAWIWLPVHENLATAVRGQGTVLDGAPVGLPDGPPRAFADLRGWYSDRFIPPDVLARADAAALAALDQRPPMSAAVAYVRLLQGASDAALLWRSYAWDHAPGSLLLAEAGGSARHLDGAAYRPGVAGRGLVLARDDRSFAPFRRALFGVDDV